MKRIHLLVLTLGLLITFSGQLTAETEIPEFPTQITLRNGAVLRKCTWIRWEKDMVVVKHAGGIDPVRFSILSEKSKSEIDKIVEAFNTPRIVHGTVFVTTRGAGAYKFANEIVLAYEEAAWMKSTKIPPESVTPIGFAKTNAEGKFEIKLPHSKPTFLYCVASRAAAGTYEHNVWFVRIYQDEMDLSELNSR
jgi:hypothetical protein